MRVVVTGGAGYIGSHVVQALLEDGHEPIVVDDFSTGRREFIPHGVAFEKIDVSDFEAMRTFFSKTEGISGLIHLAGIKYAGESVKRPLDFYRSNTFGLGVTLQAMKIANIRNIVFSSSCSVYGDVLKDTAASESSLLNPQSPYGRSKLFAEQILEDEVKASRINAVCLRYFNVAGNGNIIAYDQSPYNLFPNIYRAIDSQSRFNVYKSFTETRDGTCIRDYVDVNLLAASHVNVLHRLVEGINIDFAYNLGSGSGTSTLEIAETAKKLFGVEFNLMPARKGDPSVIMADVRKASTDLNWAHKISIDEILENGYKAWRMSKLN